MVIDERARHVLHKRLEEILGPEEAATLMEHLPPVGWADVATKRDLDQSQAATKRDIEHLQDATKRDLEVLEARISATFAVSSCVPAEHHRVDDRRQRGPGRARLRRGEAHLIA